MCHDSPKNSRARDTAAVVFPTPALPVNRRWGRLPFLTYDVKPLNDLVLAHDIPEPYGPVFFYPYGIVLLHSPPLLSVINCLLVL